MNWLLLAHIYLGSFLAVMTGFLGTYIIDSIMAKKAEKRFQEMRAKK